MLGNGLFLERQEAQIAMAAAANLRLQQMTPEERAAYDKQQKKIKAAVNKRNRISSLVRKAVHTGPLSPEEEKIRKFVIRRNWDGLFKYAPPAWWGRQTGLTHGSPAKYSFYPQPDGSRHYKAFTRDDYRNWTFSKWYSVQPGYTCPDSQREAGADYYWSGQQKWQAANPYTHPNHVFPFYPGGGARDQSYGCEKKKESTWVKIRKPLAIAVGAVAAVTLGPAVLGKIGSVFTGGGTAAAGEAAATGIVGAGAKAGAVTAVTAKAGAGAAIALKSGVAATAAAAKVAPSLFASIKGTANNLLGYYNKGSTIKAIASGEMPPPPISIEGDNFLDWATKVAVDELTKKQQRKLTRKEQEFIDLEMRRLQAQLVQQIPQNIPAYPNPQIPYQIQGAMIQEKEANASSQQDLLIMAAVALGAIVLAKGF